MTRPRKSSIQVISNNVGGYPLNIDGKFAGMAILWNELMQQYEHGEVGVSEFELLEHKPTTIAGYHIQDAWAKVHIGNPYEDFVAAFEAVLT